MRKNQIKTTQQSLLSRLIYGVLIWFMIRTINDLSISPKFPILSFISFYFVIIIDINYNSIYYIRLLLVFSLNPFIIRNVFLSIP